VTITAVVGDPTAGGSGAIPVVIDSDGGCDDAAALWWALADPALEVLAVTAIWGNTSVEQAAANLRLVCEAAGRPEVPVAVGAAGAAAPGPLSGTVRDVHGADGLGGHARPPSAGPTDDSAVEVLLRCTAERPGQVALLALGPLTNLAAAIAADQAFAARVRRLTIMGGSVRRGGNARPWAEANIALDPEAAATVVTAGWAVPPLLVGLDVTLAASLGADEAALIEQRGSPAAAFLAGPLVARAGSSGAPGLEGQPVHDLLAATCVADPDQVGGPVVPLAVDVAGGPAWGMTVADLRRHGAPPDELAPGFGLWQVALEVDVDRFRAKVRRLLA
jgi:purine nucleosidase